jgi:nucleoside-diphosphate-sugar epimerase
MYLVTGAAGFIASHVIGMMLAEGHSVIGLDNMNHAYDVRVKGYRLRNILTSPQATQFQFYPMDISNRATVESLAETISARGQKVDAIINLAARAGVRTSVEDPWVYVDTNLTGTLNMLELSRRLNIPKFILASTSSVYGENAPLPTPEEYDSSLALQPYAATKKAAEVLCHSYHYLYGTDVTVVRYFTVYGPAGRPDMVMFRFAKWISEKEPVYINGDGEQSRGFTYVEDIARGTLLSLKPLGYEVINLGGHEIVTVNQLIHMIEERVGEKAQVVYRERHPADMLSNWANVDKARRLLDWNPQVSLSDGLDRLIQWYQAEKSWVSQIATE